VRDPDGELRCLAVMRQYREAIATNDGFRRLLDDEPTVAIRVLTDPQDGRRASEGSPPLPIAGCPTSTR